MNHRILERIDCPLVLLLIFLFRNCISMPRQKCCEHPTRHANSAYGPKGVAAVSLQLSMFLVSRYDTADDRIRWLCPKCHAFEVKEMMIHQPMEFNDDQSSSDDELMEEDSPNDDELMVEDSSTDGDDNNDDELMAEDSSTDGDDNNDDELMAEDSPVDGDDNNDDELMAEDSPVDGDDNNDDNANVEFENVNEEDEHSYQMDSGIIAESKQDENDSPCTNGEATDSESIDEESDNVSYELEYQKNKAVEQLSTIFGLFNIDPIHDK